MASCIHLRVRAMDVTSYDMRIRGRRGSVTLLLVVPILGIRIVIRGALGTLGTRGLGVLGILGILGVRGGLGNLGKRCALIIFDTSYHRISVR